MKPKLTPPKAGHVGAKAKPKSPKRKVDPKVKAAADRAERRTKGESVHEAPVYSPLDPPVKVVTKRPAWRPSKYRPEFCEIVIDLGMQGKSKTVMAARLGVLPETMTEWTKIHPEFSAAVTYACVLSQEWWENAGQQLMTMPHFSASAWSKSMTARFPREWRDKVAVSGDDEGPAVRHAITVAWMTEAEAKGRGWA